MKFRFTLADKISMTIIVIGLLGITLVYYISNSYKNLAYQHHTQSIQTLAHVEIRDLLKELKSNALDLALTIENEKDFERDFRYKNTKKLTQLLDNQFYQYFVTAGVIKLLKLYILDTDFTLISTSTEGVTTEENSELICPTLSQQALKRHGSEKLQTMTRRCTYKNHPVVALIVPFGGLNPKGYIQIITDLAFKLQQIEQSLAMPIQMNLVNGSTIYQSKNWELTKQNKNYLNVEVPVTDDSKKAILYISLKPDMTVFNKDIVQHRNWIMSLAFFTTALTVFIVLLILRRSAIPPLAKIHNVLETIHSHKDCNNKNSRLLFEQLLEQIIRIRKKYKIRFSVMILDLNHFKNINDTYGKAAGDNLLMEVEYRLSSILRDSDLISWVGTDTPGHKLLPADSETKYRATIARLGGDEFGLLLPSAQTENQAKAVAQRIIETLNQPFTIAGNTIEIECKIGISLYPEHGEDEKLLVRNADKAMHQAKTHKQTFFIYQAEPAEQQAR